jgi:hypothetical protein
VRRPLSWSPGKDESKLNWNEAVGKAKIRLIVEKMKNIEALNQKFVTGLIKAKAIAEASKALEKKIT